MRRSRSKPNARCERAKRLRAKGDDLIVRAQAEEAKVYTAATKLKYHPQTGPMGVRRAQRSDASAGLERAQALYARAKEAYSEALRLWEAGRCANGLAGSRRRRRRRRR